MRAVASLVDLLFTLYIFLIIGSVFLSWGRISPYHPVAQWVRRLTEPLLGPIRRAMPQTGPFDWSPTIAIFLLIILRQVVATLLLRF